MTRISEVSRTIWINIDLI